MFVDTSPHKSISTCFFICKDLPHNFLIILQTKIGTISIKALKYLTMSVLFCLSLCHFAFTSSVRLEMNLGTCSLEMPVVIGRRVPSGKKR